jgi:hypothetical protein
MGSKEGRGPQTDKTPAAVPLHLALLSIRLIFLRTVWSSTCTGRSKKLYVHVELVLRATLILRGCFYLPSFNMCSAEKGLRSFFERSGPGGNHLILPEHLQLLKVTDPKGVDVPLPPTRPASYATFLLRWNS